MRFSGWVGGVLVSLLSAVSTPAQDAANTASSAEVFQLASESSASPELSAACCQDSNPSLCSYDWYDCLIGSCCGYHVYSGTEFTALDIDSRTGGRITLSFSDTTAPGVSTVAFNETSGLDDWGYAPRLWIGGQITDKWGVRGRYWRLADNDMHYPDLNPAIPSTGTNFATIFVTDQVEAWTADVEAVRSDTWGPWKFDTFVGGRHASYVAHSDLLAFGVFTTGNFVNLTLQNALDFNGTGVTYGGEIRRQLFGSHFYGFTGLRGSHLHGLTDSMGRSDGTVADSPSAPLVGAATVTRANAEADMTIFELQAGVQFEVPLQCIPANFFFRVAYEYQEWEIDGLPTGGAGFGGTIGELTTNSFASASADLVRSTMQGGTIGTGLTW